MRHCFVVPHYSTNLYTRILLESLSILDLYFIHVSLHQQRQTDRPTNQTTDRPTNRSRHREVTLPITPTARYNVMFFVFTYLIPLSCMAVCYARLGSSLIIQSKNLIFNFQCNSTKHVLKGLRRPVPSSPLFMRVGHFHSDKTRLSKSVDFSQTEIILFFR